MTTAVDLSHLTPAEVDDLFRRARAGEDEQTLLADLDRLRRAHLLAAARSASGPTRQRPPVWLTEAHPQFCATKDGCDGRHLSEQAEVDADTGLLYVGVEQDGFGQPTVTVEAEDPFDRTHIRLSLDAAVAMAAQLIAKVQVARSQAAMVRPERSVAA